MAWETGVQSQVESHQRLKKWFLMPPCLTSDIMLRIKDKWSNPMKGVAPRRTPRCCSCRKGTLWVAFDIGRPTYIYIHIYIYKISRLFTYILTLLPLSLSHTHTHTISHGRMSICLRTLTRPNYTLGSLCWSKKHCTYTHTNIYIYMYHCTHQKSPDYLRRCRPFSTLICHYLHIYVHVYYTLPFSHRYHHLNWSR